MISALGDAAAGGGAASGGAIGCAWGCGGWTSTGCGG
jgi:hypothetical protein